jgi:hypothetical protein
MGHDIFRGPANLDEEEIKKFDPYTHAVTVITDPHRLTHDGMVFHCSGKVTGIVDDASSDFLLVAPPVTPLHLHRARMTFGAGDVDLLAYEGVETSAQGAAVNPIFNLNRNSDNTPEMLITSNPTITAPGTLIHTQWAPPTAAGQGQSPQGIGDVDQGEEWILIPGEQYLIRVTNRSGGTITFAYEFMWFEVTYDN